MLSLAMSCGSPQPRLTLLQGDKPKHSKLSSFNVEALCPASNAGKKSSWDERRLVGSVDYDKGESRVSVEVAGVGGDQIPARYRLRVYGSRWQKDWKISEVVERLLRLNDWEDVDAVLNCWVGRFARKNFSFLIRMSNKDSLERAVQVFQWMKTQKNSCPQTGIYNMMIRLHARHNQIDQARGLFFEMQEWRDWKMASELVETMELSLSLLSVGLLNQLLHFLGKSGKYETMMKLFHKIIASGSVVSFITYSVLLKNLLAVGKWRKYIEILQWMEGYGHHFKCIVVFFPMF